MIRLVLLFLFLMFTIEFGWSTCYCACDDGQSFTEPAPPWELKSPADEDRYRDFRQVITIKEPRKESPKISITICDYDSAGEFSCKDL